MGRPAKAGEPLDHQVSFRMTKKVFDEYERKVRESGLCKSDFFREVVAKNRTEVINTSPVKTVVEHRLAPEDRRRHLKLVATINRVGNNINQLAHRANAANLAGQVSEKLLEDVLYELQVIETHLRGSIPKCS
jgi:hypothetical protein